MRVVVLSLDTKILNPKSAVYARAKEYAELVDGYHVVVLNVGKADSVRPNAGFSVTPSNSRHPLLWLFDGYRVACQLISTLGDTHDIVVTTQDPFETGLIGYWLKKRFNTGLNIQDHGNFFSSPYVRKESIFSWVRYWVGRFLIVQADSIRTVSLREKDFLADHHEIPQDRIVEAPIFTDWKALASKPIQYNLKEKYPGKSHYVLALCRLEKVKNLPLLIRSFSTVLKTFPDALLVIVGDGSQRPFIENLILRLGLKKSVHIETWTDNPTSYYKTADLFAVTSYSEGWGLTVLEAAAAKCPVIMTDTGCAGEFLTNKNGWVIPVNNESALIDALQDALSHPAKRQQLGDQAFHDLQQLPTKSQILAQLKESWELAQRKRNSS